MGKETISYNGLLFTRYPEAKQFAHKNYYQHRSKKHGRFYLHRKIWEDMHGKIPKKYVVHHKNHNPLDNRVGNLECIPHSAHSSHHSIDSYNPVTFKKRQKVMMEELRKWHKTKAGKDFHKRLNRKNKKTWANKKPVFEKRCLVCKKKYFSKINRKNAMYCGINCKGRAKNARNGMKPSPGRWKK